MWETSDFAKDTFQREFPAQFGGQEPKDDTAINEFCTLNHGVTFPLMAKSDVNGNNTNEVYQWLKSKKSGILGLTRVKVRPISYLFFCCFY
jgi:glutathione peroxidase-family protein